MSQRFKCCGVEFSFEDDTKDKSCHKCKKVFDDRCSKCGPGLQCSACYDKAKLSSARPNTPADVANHAVKFDGNKPRLELVPPSAMNALGAVLGYGAKKYAEHNYLKGMAWGRLAGASLRHTFSWLMGEDKDPESGLPHLWHALASIAMLIESIERKVGTDDRYKDPNAS